MQRRCRGPRLGGLWRAPRLDIACRNRLPRAVAGWKFVKCMAAAALDVAEQRQKQESSLRARWIRELACLIEQCGLPASCSFAGPQRELAMKRLAEGRRPSTLRKHVRTWQRISGWPSCAFGVSWPSWLFCTRGRPSLVAALCQGVSSLLGSFWSQRASGQDQSPPGYSQ